MIMQSLTATIGFGCYTPPFKQYSIWDDINLFLMLISFAVLYVGCTYYLLLALKLATNRLKSTFKKKNTK
ncbi:hypothetical protein ACM39_15040 [Chryseobacterium sp. FH2]|nr:hypothetical protein ACM39_15040 [Chryseobacterium sp. FH2]